MLRSRSCALLCAPVFLLCSVHSGVAQTDAERLEKLERAVELLQRRSTELEQEVRRLNGKAAPAAKSEVTTAAPLASEGKAVVEKSATTEEKKPPVFAVAAASEFKLTLGGFVQGQFSARAPSGAAPLFAPFRADGYYVQGAYYVIPKRLQLVTKWESFDPGQVFEDDIHSITAGVNYYLKGDDIKLLANYIHTWSDFRESRGNLGQSEFDEVIVRLPVMF